MSSDAKGPKERIHHRPNVLFYCRITTCGEDVDVGVWTPNKVSKKEREEMDGQSSSPKSLLCVSGIFFYLGNLYILTLTQELTDTPRLTDGGSRNLTLFPFLFRK